MLLAVILQACSGPGVGRGLTEGQEAWERAFAARRKKAAQSAVGARGNAALVHELNLAIDDYSSSIRRRENDQADRRARALETVISRLANEIRPHLLDLLQDKVVRNRMIAAAALGFTDYEDQARDALSYALEDEDVGVRINACFGLGILGAVLTPMDQLNKFVSDPAQPVELRKSASFALMKLQQAGAPRKNFETLWPLLLEGDPLRKDYTVLVHSLRGLGLLRNRNNLDFILPYLKHPKPLIVIVALIAAARCENRQAAKHILLHLGSHQHNTNVRLHARKALKKLTGDRVDHEYNIEAWQQEFGLVALPDGGYEKKRATKPKQKD